MKRQDCEDFLGGLCNDTRQEGYVSNGIATQKNRAMKNIGKIIVIFIILVTCGQHAFGQGWLDITGIAGHSDGSGVKNGKWTGQPLHAPNRGKYNGFYVIESQNSNYYWDILGKNFGKTQGSVWLLDRSMKPVRDIKITIARGGWTDTKIRVVPVGPYTLESRELYLCVSRTGDLPNSSNSWSDTFYVKVIGAIQTRGFGQCTWEVAYQRLLSGKSIPSRAYPSNMVSITSSYIPQKDDVLFVGTRHTAIITSTPKRQSSGGTTTWTFTVTERNHDWNETRSSRSSSFSVSGNRVITPIRGGMTSPFDAYWR